MPSGGIICGVTPGGQSVAIGATPEGELDVNPDSFAIHETMFETNRLLRKLIAGLEMYLGNEFPEVE